MTMQDTSPPTQTYLQALEKGRFLIQRCNACHQFVFFPRVFCIHCDRADLSWHEPHGGGWVYSTTTVRRKSSQGGDYDVSIIELDEGVRLMSSVIDIDPSDVKIGMRVKAGIIKDTDQTSKLIFRSAENAND